MSKHAQAGSRLLESYGNYYQINEGQLARDAIFKLSRPEGTLWGTTNGVVADYFGTKEGSPVDKSRKRSGHAVFVEVEGAKPGRVRGVGPVKTPFNYFVGNASVVQQTRYKEVWRDEIRPGVAARYYMDGDSPRYDYIFKNPSSVADFSVRYRGVASLRIGADGALVYDTSVGTVREQGLVAYQVENGKKTVLPSQFKVLADNRVRFAVKGANPKLPLVIDPQVVKNGSHYSHPDVQGFFTSLASMSNGDVITGTTTIDAVAPPTFPGAYQSTHPGSAYLVLRWRPNFSGIVYGTYIGNANDTYIETPLVRLDRSDARQDLVVGCTAGGDGMPTTGAAFSASSGGQDDVWFGRLSSSFGTLKAASYFGGITIESLRDFTISAGGNVYFCGMIDGPRLPFLATDERAQGWHGSNDGWVAGLNKGLSSQIFGVYIGGSGYDEAMAINMANDGTMFITGSTASADFYLSDSATLAAYPPYQTTLHGFTDAFVVRMRVSGRQSFGTFYGGSDTEEGTSLGVTPTSNQVVIGGISWSDDLPMLANSAQPTRSGLSDGFLARFTSNLGQLGGATFAGGSSYDSLTAVKATDSKVFAVGFTSSADFPVTDPLDAFDGSSNATLMRLNGQLSTRFNSMCLWRGGLSYGFGLELLDGAIGNILVAGGSSAPITFAAPSYNPQSDGFSPIISTVGFSGDPVDLILGKTSITGGQALFAEMRLNLPAGPSGMNITWATSDPSLVSFKNATQLIPPGVSYISNKIFTAPVISPANVTISASGSGTTITRTLTINP